MDDLLDFEYNIEIAECNNEPLRTESDGEDDFTMIDDDDGGGTGVGLISRQCNTLHILFLHCSECSVVISQ